MTDTRSSSDSAEMLRARALVEYHILNFGYVPHPDKLKEAVAAALATSPTPQIAGGDLADVLGWLLDAIKSEVTEPTPLFKRRFAESEKALLAALSPQAGETKSAPVVSSSLPSGESNPSVTLDCAGAGTPHRLDPFPFRGTDARLFNIACIIDPSIQLSTTPESMREEALRKAQEIAGACGAAQGMQEPIGYAYGNEVQSSGNSWFTVRRGPDEYHDMPVYASPPAALPAGEAIERRWTEDELALAFFDFSACTQARCTFKRMGGCHCVINAYRAVNMVKNVLPRSFPLASSGSSTDREGGK